MKRLKKFRLFLNGNIHLVSAVNEKMKEVGLEVSQPFCVYPRIGWLYIGKYGDEVTTTYDESSFSPTDEDFGPEVIITNFFSMSKDDFYEEVVVKYPVLAKFNNKSMPEDEDRGGFYVLFTENKVGTVVKSDNVNRPLGYSSDKWFKIDGEYNGHNVWDILPVDDTLLLTQEGGYV